MMEKKSSNSDENRTDKPMLPYEKCEAYGFESLTDEELLSYMKEKFDGECRGDLEYLSGTVLEEFARTVRKGTRKYIGRYRENGDGI